MKRFLRPNFFLSLMVAAGIFSPSAFSSTPIEKMVPVDHIYSPKGFDSNDNAEIVVTGHLPNLCHKTPMTKVKIDGHRIKIKLTSLYYQSSNPYCPTVVVPFTQSVSLGVLDKGQYEITVNGGHMGEKKSLFTISESRSPAVDEHIYSDVEYIEKKVGEREVVLHGYNPSDCLTLKEIKTVSNESDTYSVLPIMEQISDFCPMKMVPFKYKYQVPTELKREKVLLHVRSMEGKSINTVFENK